MRVVSVCIVLGIIAAGTSTVNAAVTLDGNLYSQDFNSLSASGTSWANDSTITGWSLFRRPAPGTPITAIAIGSGSSNAGSFYSFGLDDDRALGGVGSGGTYWGSPSTGTVAGWITAQFTNGANTTFDSFTIAYDGEQWRQGGNSTPQTMAFEYGFGGSFDSITWVAPGGTFDFTSPIVSTGSALDGNAAENRVAGLGGTIAGLAWTPGDSLWVRWIENNDAGNDHGLAIDNFSINTTGGGVDPVESGDFNGDGFIDAADYTIWRDNENQTGVGLAGGDGNNDGTVDALDYAIWSQQYAPAVSEGAAAIPEPGSLVIAIACLLAGARKQRARN
jgi:hypothetical protein